MSYFPAEMRVFYEELDFDTLPLRPGSKEPAVRAWERTDSFRLWQNAPEDANIGIRTGDGLAVIDCDEYKKAGTCEHATAWLAGMGYLEDDYPVVQTASQIGRHIYVAFSGELPGNYRLLADEFGAGEFRYGSGAYVVAPPSSVGNGVYMLIAGDYRQIPRLRLEDILQILKNRDTQPAPVPLKISRRAYALLHGRGIEKFASRSEAEQSILVSLFNAGHDFDSILNLFLTNPCAGKFIELRTKSVRNAISWLKHSYDEAVVWAKTHESPARQTAQAAITWAESSPWPGGTGKHDRAVYIAHCTIAYRAGMQTYSASCRELADLAGVSAPAAASATTRLCNAGLLTLEKPATVDCPNIYQLVPKYYTP